MKRKEKENFVKKFFPSCVSSPGGTQNLVANKPTDVTSAEGRGVGKRMARSSGILAAKTFNFNFTNDLRTDTLNTKKELDMQTSFGLFGGTDETSTESNTTNHRRGRGKRE